MILLKMKLLCSVFTIAFLPAFTTGGYVSNPSSYGGYASIVGGYPSGSQGGYSSSNAGGYSSPDPSPGGYGDCCPDKYPFLPAPPGQAPPCSRNGMTFCEKLDTYPTETIRYLLYKYGSTYSQFIKTEINQDFVFMNYTFYPKPEYGPYGAPSYAPYGAPSSNVYRTYNSHYNGSAHNRQPRFQQPRPSSYTTIQQQDGWQPVFNHEQAAAVIVPPLVQSIWWNHIDRNTKRSAYPYIAEHRYHRSKRQIDTDNRLCRLSSRFIVPQAAMNNQGNWMYVVNMDDSRYIQQVRTEECAEGDGSACSGLCSIPPGYRATCRQKYVQKRLIALEGTGQSLQSEVFWFPHCCVCEVTRG